MSRSLNEFPVAASSSNKGLWVAVAVLGAAVVAMGAFWVGEKTQPIESRSAAVPAVAMAPATPTPSAAPGAAPATAPATVSVPATPSAAGIITEMKDQPAAKKAPAAAAPAPAAAKSVAPHTAKATTAPVAVAQAPTATPAAVSAPAPTPVAGAKSCNNCGTITAATAVQRDGPGSGLGAVAGGVLGGVLGNQVGGGDGKTIATILGAVGGGFAGNAVEKKMKKETIYEVQVRMDDGSSRTLELGAPVAVGAKVTVEGSALRFADGTVSTPVPPRPAPVPAAAPGSTNY